MEIKKYRPVVLTILDGWGINAELEGNAIAEAKTPTVNFLKANYPCIALQASGISVGLAWGEPGNSEVGHMTIGSGMIVYQNLPRINLAIQNGTFYNNPVINEAMDSAKKRGAAVHLMGLVSTGGVHSQIDHLFALMEVANLKSINKLFIHIFTDGRDTPPNESIKYVKLLQEKIASLGIGKIASIGGRNWAMDRNQNWDRVAKGYRALVGESENKTKDPAEAISSAYQKKIGDEFIEPTVIVDEQGVPVGPIQDGDSVIFFNFREDRAREITEAFVQESFAGFKRSKELHDLCFVTMVEYDKNLPVKVIFSPQKISNPLAKILANERKTQLHMAETEKYAHVTYFFNGGREEIFPGEDRVVVPSPQTGSYEETPEMSSSQITEKFLENLQLRKYDFILINFSNADMLGHTGNMEATIKAVQAVDYCLGKVIKATLDQKGALIITADHGNAEAMINIKTGEKLTEHSSNPVPCFLVTPDNKKVRTDQQIMRHQSVVDGMLVDLAPTILEMMDIPISQDMVGNSLLEVLK